MYFFAWGILCYWRGLWNLVDLYFGEGWVNSAICYVCAAVSIFCRPVLLCWHMVGQKEPVKLSAQLASVVPKISKKRSFSAVVGVVFDVSHERRTAPAGPGGL